MRIVTLTFTALAVLLLAPAGAAQDTPGSKVRQAWLRVQARNEAAAEAAAAEEAMLLAQALAKREAWGFRNTERLARLEAQEIRAQSENRARRLAWAAEIMDASATVAENHARRLAWAAGSDTDSIRVAAAVVDIAVENVTPAVDRTTVAMGTATADPDAPQRQRRRRAVRAQMRQEIEAEVENQEIGGAWSGPPVYVRPAAETVTVEVAMTDSEPMVTSPDGATAMATAMATDAVSDDVRRARREAWAANHARKVAMRIKSQGERELRRTEVQERMRLARVQQSAIRNGERVALAMDSASIQQRRDSWAAAQRIAAQQANPLKRSSQRRPIRIIEAPAAEDVIGVEGNAEDAENDGIDG